MLTKNPQSKVILARLKREGGAVFCRLVVADVARARPWRRGRRLEKAKEREREREREREKEKNGEDERSRGKKKRRRRRRR